MSAFLLLVLFSNHTIADTPGNAPEKTSPGKKIGVFKISYYFMVVEEKGGDWPLYSSACKNVITYTSRSFHDRLSLEGSGMLIDGRIVNFEERCPCARPGFRGSRVCYRVLDKNRFPWGKGVMVKGKPMALKPFHSVAVDPKIIPFGKWLYIPAWRGKTRPDGQILNGRFRAEDTGGLIKNRRLDFFTGTSEWADWLQKTYPISKVSVYSGDRFCG